MPTRNVVLADQQPAMIERLIHDGRYRNACEDLSDGLHMAQHREAEDDTRLTGPRQDVKRRDGDESFARTALPPEAGSDRTDRSILRSDYCGSPPFHEALSPVIRTIHRAAVREQPFSGSAIIRLQLPRRRFDSG